MGGSPNRGIFVRKGGFFVRGVLGKMLNLGPTGGDPPHQLPRYWADLAKRDERIWWQEGPPPNVAGGFVWGFISKMFDDVHWRMLSFLGPEDPTPPPLRKTQKTKQSSDLGASGSARGPPVPQQRRPLGP